MTRENETQKNKFNKTSFRLLFYFSSIIFILWIITFISYFTFFKKEAISFGDPFDAINALFAGLAFAGLIFTAYLQRKELELQREELELQRNEITKSTTELREQKELMDLQKFENKYFQLINLHHKITGNFTDNLLVNVYSEVLKSFTIQSLNQDRSKKLNTLNDVYVYSFIKNREKLGHYFRNLFHIIKFIDSTPELKSFEQRYSYVRILRAQLSNTEIVILALNGISEYGKDFKPLIENYKLLKNIAFDNVKSDELYKQLKTEYPHLNLKRAR